MIRMFRSTAIATSLFLLATATHAQGASEELVMAGTANVEFGWGITDEVDEGSGGSNRDSDYPMLAGGGAISLPVLPMVSIQVDTDGAYDFVRPSSPDNVSGHWRGGGHISLRRSDLGLVGIFGGYARGWNENTDDQDQANAGWIGVEGQAYLGPVTTYVQASYFNGNVDDTEEKFNPAFELRGVVRYFLSDDQRIQAEISYASADDSIDDDDRMFGVGWGVRYDQRLMGQLHGFVSYRGNHYDTTTEIDVFDEHIPSIGLTYLFGAESLKANDRRGATLDHPSIGLSTTNWAQPID